MLLVWLDRRQLPEVVAIVFHPRGSLRLSNELTLNSPQGLSTCQLRWRVIELWNISADDLLAASDVGLIPWVPLSRLSRPVEAVFQECRDRIERDATPDERENLLAVTQVMASLRYNDQQLLTILGGRQMLMEMPLIQEVVAEGRQRTTSKVLSARFGPIPPDIAARIAAVTKEEQLDELAEISGTCADWDELRAKFPA